MSLYGRTGMGSIKKFSPLVKHGSVFVRTINVVAGILLFGLNMLRLSIHLYFGWQCMEDSELVKGCCVGTRMLIALVSSVKRLLRLLVTYSLNVITLHKSGCFNERSHGE